MLLVTSAYLKEVVGFYEKWSLAIRLINNLCFSFLVGKRVLYTLQLSHLSVKSAVKYEDHQPLKRITDGEYVLEDDSF